LIELARGVGDVRSDADNQFVSVAQNIGPAGSFSSPPGFVSHAQVANGIQKRFLLRWDRRFSATVN
jgi:hypothetical protein